MRHAAPVLAALSFVGVAAPAIAQSSIDGRVEVTTDDRRRGISWSDGKPTAAAGLTLGLPAGFDIGARVSGTRRDPRHGGADVVIDPTLGYRRDLGGGFRLDAFAQGHVFAGGLGGLSYGEGGVDVGFLLGPAELIGEARYAPDQAAIGGDNLYLGARTRIGVPATPYTVTASIGRSSGSVDDLIRAARLRPDGRYANWSLGVERVTGPITLTVEYTGTDIADGAAVSRFANRRDAGDRLAARAAFSF
jgi:uncharacterized protein (TIGR02001 family)